MVQNYLLLAAHESAGSAKLDTCYGKYSSMDSYYQVDQDRLASVGFEGVTVSSLAVVY